MDKYNFESIHDWTYQELCDEVEMLDNMDLCPDKIRKLTSLEKVTDLYRTVTKNKRMIFENDEVNDYLKQYDLLAFFGNDQLYENQLRLKGLRGRIRAILLKERVKVGYEMDSEFMKMERMINPSGKPPTKLLN